MLLESLKRLEYRGYDSWGMALACDGQIQIFRQRKIQHQHALPLAQLLQSQFAAVGETHGVAIAVRGRRDLRKGRVLHRAHAQFVLHARRDVLQLKIQLLFPPAEYIPIRDFHPVMD